MHGVNLSVISDVHDWLQQGRSVWLATIVKTWGASPRPPGSLFAYNAVDDLVSGSVSGGCVEDELLAELRDRAAPDRPFKRLYGIDGDERQRLQLPCGGHLELIIEYLPATQVTTRHISEILQTLAQKRRVCRRIDLTASALFWEPSDAPVGIVANEDDARHVLGPQDRLLIVGIGEVARYLVPQAQALDFAVTLCDPRADAFQRFSHELLDVETVHGLPDDLIRSDFQDNAVAIVTLSHDPRVDDMALMAALESRAFYVGAMGSQRTSENRMQRLSELGFTEAQLARLEAPIGLPIGSKTPPEIAVSIAAQLIQMRSRRGAHAGNNN